VVVPLAAGYVTRRSLNQGDPDTIANFTGELKPFSIIGRLATVVLLFGFQAQTIIDKPGVIVLIAIPLIIQSYGIFLIAYVHIPGKTITVSRGWRSHFPRVVVIKSAEKHALGPRILNLGQSESPVLLEF
jgi:ACR3 family arsenite efflux pump ArsB